MVTDRWWPCLRCIGSTALFRAATPLLRIWNRVMDKQLANRNKRKKPKRSALGVEYEESMSSVESRECRVEPDILSVLLFASS